MFRHVLQLSSHVPGNSGARLFPCAVRKFCTISKDKKKRATKVVASDVSKVSDPKAATQLNISNFMGETTTSRPEDTFLPAESSVAPVKAKTTKKQLKTATKNDTKKSIKEKKSSKVEVPKPEETPVSFSERYGDSIIPGMKPFSTKKKKDLSEVKPRDKTSEDKERSSAETVTKSEKAVPTFRDTFDFSEVIPKIRTPSFRLEQKLEVPHEWTLMAQSWTPSQEFLDNIMKFPIGGLEKSTNVEGKHADSVSCFMTVNKNAAKVVPAVTTVLSKTMTSAQAYALKLWRERMTQQLGEEGFQQHHTQILTRGKQFHDTIQRYLHGESVQSLSLTDSPLITGCWKSLIPILNRIDDVIAVESEVLHPQLLYRGVIDCIVEIKGQPFIVEWKHSSRKKDSLQKNYDSPVQLMAYTGAINSNASYPFGVKNSLLVVAYDDGSPADVFLLSAPENGDHHWQIWLKRLHTYWSLLKAERDLGS